VQRVTDIMAEISAASQEQSAGIEQVNQTVVQMDETTQQNAALVEKPPPRRAMEEQANLLAEAVSVFRTGAATAAAAVRPALAAVAATITRCAARCAVTPHRADTGGERGWLGRVLKGGKPVGRRCPSRWLVAMGADFFLNGRWPMTPPRRPFHFGCQPWEDTEAIPDLRRWP
jgi:hypothetical protein